MKKHIHVTIITGLILLLYVNTIFARNKQKTIHQAFSFIQENELRVANTSFSFFINDVIKNITINTANNKEGIIAPTFTCNTNVNTNSINATLNKITSNANLFLTDPCNTIVTSNADSGPGTLREIITNACVGSTITFDPSVTNIALTSGDIAITQGITITGPGANLLIISGSHLSRIFDITAGSSTVSISGVSIQDGNPQDGASNATNGGGGILITSGSLVLTGCVITNNDCSLTSNAEGGGIDNEGSGTITIDLCSITNNISMEDGGGITHFGTALMTITNSTISGNTAAGGDGANGDGWGGGILMAADLTITNCTINRNNGYNYGGNIMRFNAGTLTMGNSIVAGGSLAGHFVTAASGLDIFTLGTITSNGYNLIQNTGGYTIDATNNIQGVNPKLLPAANYGGSTITVLPMSNSPIINAGSPALTTGTDQRGLPRNIDGAADIGAVETNFAFSASGGTPQSTAVSTNFTFPLQTTVTESGNNIAGDSVTYSAPATGASGTFPGPVITVTIVSDVSGIATSPTFTANEIIGTYNVTSNFGSLFAPLNFMLNNNVITPVTFGTFTVTAINCTALVQWQTLTESNSKSFVVEHSINGVYFESLSTLPAKGNSTTLQAYQYVHSPLAQGTNYYRIKQTDLDGAFTYSNIVIVTDGCNTAPIVAYPNPVIKNLTVVLPGIDKQTITILDAVGRRINEYIVNGGTQLVDATRWAKGMYSVTVSKNGITIFVSKVIKE